MPTAVLSHERVTLGPVYLVPSAEGGMTLRAATKKLALRGAAVTDLFGQLLPLLDGSHTYGDVVAELAKSRDRQAIEPLCEQLVSLDVIRPVPPTDVPAQVSSIETFLRGYGAKPLVAERIQNASVLVVGEGALLPTLAIAVASLGVPKVTLVGRTVVSSKHNRESAQLLSTEAGGSLAEAAAESVRRLGLTTSLDVRDNFAEDELAWTDLLRDVDAAALALDAPVVSLPWIEQFNRAALNTGTPWTSGALLDRTLVHVGPSIIPGETACWKCFETRFRSNIGTVGRYDEFQQYLSDKDSYIDTGSVPVFADFLAPLIAFELLRLLCRDQVLAATVGKLMTFHLWDYETTLHPVLKLPRCPDCSATGNVPVERIWG